MKECDSGIYDIVPSFDCSIPAPAEPVALRSSHTHTHIGGQRGRDM